MKKKKKEEKEEQEQRKGKLEFAPRQWTRDRPCQGQGREGLAAEVSDRLCFRHEYTITTTNYLTFTPLPDPFPRIHHPLPRSNDILELRSYFALYCLVPSSISTSRSLPTIPIIARNTRRRHSSIRILLPRIHADFHHARTPFFHPSRSCTARSLDGRVQRPQWPTRTTWIAQQACGRGDQSEWECSLLPAAPVLLEPPDTPVLGSLRPILPHIHIQLRMPLSNHAHDQQQQ